MQKLCAVSDTQRDTRGDGPQPQFAIEIIHEFAENIAEHIFRMRFERNAPTLNHHVVRKVTPASNVAGLLIKL